jgi:hypothetical protein
MKRLTLFVAFGTLGVLLFASSAQATHPRPAAGAQFRVPIVIAYTQCVAPTNRFHGVALEAPSCNRGADTDSGQTSNWLTTGGGAAPQPAAAGSSFVKVTTCVAGTTASGTCSTPPGMSVPDVRIEANGTQVLCKVGGPSQGQCTGGQYSTYNGQVLGDATIRITDHHNAVAPAGTGDTATVIDLPFPVAANCTNGTCNVVTHANGVVPGAVQPAKRGNVEIRHIMINDGGQAGVADSPDDTLFATQGIFIP